MKNGISRRRFMQQGSIAVAGAALAHGMAIASERIRIGIIGTANRGGQLIEALAPHEDAEIVAFCDVHGAALKRWQEEVPDAFFCSDYRQVLDRNDIDAVVIATPDHWHALQAIHACESGKDVYVEKPLALTIHEGRRIIEAARKHGRIVQVGLQRRSSGMYKELAELVQGGALGKVTVAHCYRVSNMTPLGMGRSQVCDPPDDLDWDMWIGPQKMRPYQENITPYKFRWWKEYSSQIGNWGVHYFDLIRWILGETAPVSVCALGGRFAVDDDRTIPDTLQATFELPSGCLLVFGQYEASGNTPFVRPAEIELRGELGTLYAGNRGYEIVAERGGQFQDRETRRESVQKASEDADHTVGLMRNFLDCIKTRERPVCDVEEGHHSTIFAHLANIALEKRATIAWNAEEERITNHETANDMLFYQYREPWRLM